MQKLFVFDLDDVLIYNVHNYSKPILDACDLIIRTLGFKTPHVTKLVNMIHDADMRMRLKPNPYTGKPFMYSKDRFPFTLASVYLDLCSKTKTKQNASVELLLRQIGMRAFAKEQHSRNINPQAKPVLDFLRVQGDTLILCTKGDPYDQQNKITALEQAGINHFASRRIVNEKPAALFREIAEEFRASQCYSIGNSFDSDIAPALEAGYKGICVPLEIWEELKKEKRSRADMRQKNCVMLEQLKDLIKMYRRLP